MELPKKKKSIRYGFLLLTVTPASILLAASVFILFLNRCCPQIALLSAILAGALCLVFVLFPVLYFFVFRPLVRENMAHIEMERELQASEGRYRTLAETSPDCIKLFDVHGKLIYINPGGLHEHRLKDLEEAKRFNFIDGIIEEDRAKFAEALQKASKGILNTIEIRHTSEGADRTACLETMAPVRDANGKVTCVFGVSRDISELKELEHVKESLTQMIAHDLGNSLGIIINGLEYLQKYPDDLASQNARDAIQYGMTAAQEIQDMLSDLLDIAKMEERKLALRYSSINLPTFMESIKQGMRSQAQKNSVELIINLAEGLSEIKADEYILRRVFLNLIGNALKFSPSNSQITITAAFQDKGRNVTFGIRDQGEGIPPKYLPVIFDKFFQAHDREIRKHTGKGIGLAFCKLAVEAHHGKIWAESEPGKGSTFYFTLPT